MVDENVGNYVDEPNYDIFIWFLKYSIILRPHRHSQAAVLPSQKEAQWHRSKDCSQ